MSVMFELTPDSYHAACTRHGFLRFPALAETLPTLAAKRLSEVI